MVRFRAATTANGWEGTMPRITIADVEQRIYDLEKFEVRILNPDGSDARGDREIMAHYDFLHTAPHRYSCEEWRNKRFARWTRACEVDFGVDILSRDNRRA